MSQNLSLLRLEGEKSLHKSEGCHKYRRSNLLFCTRHNNIVNRKSANNNQVDNENIYVENKKTTDKIVN